MKRAIVIVIDALGVGAMPDAKAFGDPDWCNTLGNVARANGGLRLPNLGALGLGNIIAIEGVPAVDTPLAGFGRMAERSHGKDTTTGHWELAGIVLEEPFHVYPDGFPGEIMEAFVNRCECGGFLGNRPASGTAVIEELDEEHQRTGVPIIYTSADSVFQIACDVDRVPLETLYSWCQTARELLNENADRHNVSRVIARPYHKVDGKPARLSGKRHDYAVPPPRPTVMDAILARGGRTIAIGKIADIFLGRGISHSMKTEGNTDGLLKTLRILRHETDLAELHQPGMVHGDAGEFIFVNLVDTDSLYGHRNDAAGYGKALEEIDQALPAILAALDAEDLLIITGDHGCDPTTPGTDHTREHVPLLIYSSSIAPQALGTRDGFTCVANTVAEWLGFQGGAF